MPPSLVPFPVVFSVPGVALRSSRWPVIPFPLGLVAVAHQDLSRVDLSVIHSPLSQLEIDDAGQTIILLGSSGISLMSFCILQ